MLPKGPPPPGVVPRPSTLATQDLTATGSPITSHTPLNQTKRIGKKFAKYSSTLHISLSTQEVYEHTTDKGSVPRCQPIHGSVPRCQPMLGSVPELCSVEATDTAESCKLGQDLSTSHYLTPPSIISKSKSAPTSLRNSLILEGSDVSDDDDDESMSITTGRLSLSLGTDSINVKSEVIQTEQVDAVEHSQQGGEEEECASGDQLGKEEGVIRSLPVEVAAVEEEGEGQSNPGNCVGGVSVVSGGIM